MNPSSTALTLLTLSALLTCSCTGPRPLKGGKAITTPKSTGGIEQSLVQGANPSAPSRQDQETVRVRSYSLPAGSRIELAPALSAPPAPSAPRPSAFNPPVLRSPPRIATEGAQPSAFLISAPMPVLEKEETRASTELGAAQKDTARELGARLSSLKGIVWVGVALFIFGLASIFWPPLKLILGSLTTSLAITLGGIALMILPTLVVGNELLILAGVAIAVIAWFLAHRHGHLRGLLDANKNDLDDRPEKSSPVTHK